MTASKNYRIEYVDENYFRKLERSVKKYNMLAYKKLVFDCYQALRDGNFLGEKIEEVEDGNVYELALPTDALFAKVHGQIKLIYKVIKGENKILLDKLIPEGILNEGHMSQLETYKGVMVSKKNAEKDMFKIDLLNMINNNK